MTRDYESLTDSEKQTLRLTAKLGQAGLIARERGLSQHTVYAHWTSAKRKLSARTPIEAANLLAEHERHRASENVAYESFGVEHPGASGFLEPVSRLPWPWPTKGRPTNDLSFGAKCVAVLGLAVVFMAVVAFYFAGIGLLSSLL